MVRYRIVYVAISFWSAGAPGFVLPAPLHPANVPGASRAVIVVDTLLTVE
jgi:hypothetical protein